MTQYYHLSGEQSKGMTSRERIRVILAGEPADRAGFWLGMPDPETWPIYLEYFSESDQESVRRKLGDDYRWIMAGDYKHPDGPLADIHTVEEAEAVDWPNADYLDFSSALGILKNAGDVCFGSLAQRAPLSRRTIRALLYAPPPDALRVFDINLRGAFYGRRVIEESLQPANILKLNEHELPVLCDLLGLAGDEDTVLGNLAEQYALEAIALTKGDAGSILLCSGERSVHPGTQADCIDTIGLAMRLRPR